MPKARTDPLCHRPRGLTPARLVVTVVTVTVALAASLAAGCREGGERTVATPAAASAPAAPAAPSRPTAPPAPAPAAAPSAPPAAPRAEDVAVVVESLLARVAGSGLVFIRNGREHTAAKAAAHLRDKYEHLRDEIGTPEDFIDKAATKSMLSGKPYLVKLPDGTTRRAADWLRELLAEYRAERAADEPRGASSP